MLGNYPMIKSFETMYRFYRIIHSPPYATDQESLNYLIMFVKRKLER